MRTTRRVVGSGGVALVMLAAAALGCRQPIILPNPVRSVAPVVEAVAGPGPSASTGAVLSDIGIADVAAHRPRVAFAALEQRLAREARPSPVLLLALAELADRVSRRPVFLPGARREALNWSRDSAVYAAFCLDDPRCDEASRLAACDVHNRAVARCLRLAGTSSMPGWSGWPCKLADAGIVPTAAPVDWRSLGFDRLQPADDLIVTRQVARQRRAGIGIPVLARRRLLGPDLERWRPYGPFQATFAATVLIRAAGGATPANWRSQPVELVLQDPLREGTPAVGGGSPPLAWDLTAPLVARLTERPMWAYQYYGVFDPDYYLERAGIYAVDPYQPGKMPFVLFQGLWSSPDEWSPMLNTLRADPILRDRFQFWVALYPSGYAPPVAALSLRRALREIRDRFDPGHRDGALDRMVVLGKSSGGLFAKMLVQSSGREMWDAVFARPIGEIRATGARRAELSAMFFYEPEPSIARVIFVSTGHRGSDLARKPGVRTVEQWVHAGDPMLGVRDRLIADNGGKVFHPTYRGRALSTHDGLNGESPLMKVIQRTPIAPGVAHHSIIGNSRRTRAPERMTDGVVDYASAHIEGAASERIIKMGHASETHPEVIAEVRRILHVHLAETQ
jgi:hypothetical protein